MRIFYFSSSRRFSPGSHSDHRKVDGLTDFNAHIALQVDIIQVVASKDRWPGDLLLKTL